MILQAVVSDLRVASFTNVEQTAKILEDIITSIAVGQ